MDVLMPQLGETVAEGKISKWFKSSGDVVKPGDNLFEIETDKVSMEVPAIVGGVLTEIRVAAGEVAPVGAVVALIADGAVAAAGAVAAVPTPSPAGRTATTAATAAVTVPPASVPAVSSRPLDPFFEVRTPARNFGPAKLAGGTVVTPLARRLAGEAGIDLSGLRGSGPHGRIVARDVESAIVRGTAVSSATPAAAGASAAQVKALYSDTPYEEVPLDGMRRTIAARLLEAKQSIPHFYLTVDVALERLLALRQEVNVAALKDHDGAPSFRLSINDFIIKAWALALLQVPAANAVWAGDRILRLQHADVGVAVSVDGGLLTPVIRQVEAKSLSAISAEIKDLAARARARKLMPAEYQGGSSTISNLGMYGVREFAAIINPPQATILAVGAAQRRPVEGEGGGIRFASQMTVTLSCDHRVVDGALGAELLDAFRRLTENPLSIIV